MEVSWLLFGIISFVTFVIYYIFFVKNKLQKCGIPSLSPLTSNINLLRLFLRKFSVIDNLQTIYNINNQAKYVGFYSFKRSIILLRDVELIKSVLVKNFEYFVDRRPLFDPDTDPLLGTNLFSLKGDKWREVRTLLTPSFTSNKMKSMFILMSECAEKFANHIAEKSAKDPIEWNSKEIFSRYTNDTIATCAFGVEVDSMSNPNNEFYIFGKKATNFAGINFIKFLLSRVLPGLCNILGIKLISDDVEQFFYQVIRDTIATRDEKGIVRPDMLQIMMEARHKNPEGQVPTLSIEKMTSQAFIFFFAGFETTSTLLCFAVHEIAVNPDIQERLQCEIDEMYEKYGTLTYEAVNSMKYLDAIINEALRLYPAVTFLDRLCTKTFELPPALPGSKPYVIEAGQNVWIPVWSVHRNPEYFPEPEKFLPERFLDDAKEHFNSSAYMPFGVGPRMCIGNRFALLETKVLLIHLLHKCNVSISKKMKIPIKISTESITLMTEGGFWVEFKSKK